MSAFKADFKALVQTQRTIKSQSGYSFNIQDDVWRLLGEKFNFDRLAQDAKAGFLASLKTEVVADFLTSS